MDHELEEEKVDQTLSWREKMAVEEHEKLSPRLVYEIIRRDGAEELDRPTAAHLFRHCSRSSHQFFICI